MICDEMAVIPWSPDPKQPVTLDVRRLDHLGLLAAIWDDIGLTDVLNHAIGADPQVTVVPGTVFKALVLNTLAGRAPLWRVQDFFARKVPTDELLGQGVHARDFNDTSLGRHLDRFHDAGADKVFDAFSMRFIVHERMELDRALHVDTTSRVMFDEYDHPEAPDLLSVTHGHSKAHRPDLKQIMAGIVTDADGYVVVGRMLDGNTDDKTWFGYVLGQLRQWLRRVQDEQMHLVGDAALITKENLDVAAREKILVTGRLPRTVNVCNEVVRQALAQPERFVDIGAGADSKGATSFQAQRVEREVLGHAVQLGVYRSQESQARAKGTAQRQAKKALEQATKEARALYRKEHSTADDASSALQHALKRHEGSLVRASGQVVTQTRQAPAARGRPRKEEVRPTTQVYRVQLLVEIDSAAVALKAREDACFVLLHTGTEALTAREILRHYKGQANVEKRFPFLKDPAWVEAFVVKRPERVEVLGYVFLMALMLWTTWERRVRRNLATSGGGPLHEPSGIKHTWPTAAACVHVMEGVNLVRAVQGGQPGPWRLPGPLHGDQARLVALSAAIAPVRRPEGRPSVDPEQTTAGAP